MERTLERDSAVQKLPDEVDATFPKQRSVHTARSRRRAVLAGAVGNIVEWYDWTIYALFAVYFSEQIFPNSNPTASLLAALAVFAVGFVARPVGSVLLGRICDRVGRRAALSTTVTIMAITSLGIALVPTAASIGIWAAVILLALRIIQGLSLGGETSAVGAFLAESAPANRRGIFTSVYATTIMIGTLLGAAVGLLLTTVMTDAELSAFGWRIPFLIGGVLGIVGFFIRRGTRETLDRSVGHDPKPVRTVLAKHRASAAVTFVIVGAASLSFFGLISGFPALAKASGHSAQVAFEANTLALIGLVVLIPIFGWCSDRIGRRRLLILGFAGLALTCVPALMLLASGQVLAGQLIIVIPEAAVQAVLIGSLLERFPSRLRGSGFGLCFAFAVAVFGGTGPMISTWLVGNGSLVWFGVYVAVTCAVAAVVAVKMRETAFESLPE